MNEFDKITRKLNKAKESHAVSKALAEQAMKELKDEFQCNTVEEAEALLEKLEKKKNRLTTRLQKALDAIEEQLDD